MLIQLYNVYAGAGDRSGIFAAQNAVCRCDTVGEGLGPSRRSIICNGAKNWNLRIWGGEGEAILVGQEMSGKVHI